MLRRALLIFATMGALNLPNTSAIAAEVWGFADLHAHPASHLAFGADANGENGIFYGKPGLKFSDAQTTIVNDLKACSPDKHSGFTLDPAEHEIRKAILKIVDGMGGGLEHQASGAPDFKNWPAARSISHQQMHISDIRRAYDGGLRLLVASVTNNQLLHKAWHANTGTLGDFIVNTKLPRPDFGFDFDSAVKQISFIKTLVSSNADWMEIVLTAQQARNAIQSGKLAIVLGLEMDSLTLKQILDLVDNHGVRQVIPIHLADNGFGGAAVYEEFFNYNTEWLNARFFSVDFDPKLRFRLKKPDGRVSNPSDKTPPPETLNYLAQPGGHKNKNGLFGKFSMFELMKKGVLVDVAHMGAKSIDDTLALAVNEGKGYPVMDSHTGLRDDQQESESERHLSFSQAERIRQLGGVIGVGATGDLIAPLPNPCDVAGRNQCIADAEARFRECKAERDVAPGVCDKALFKAREECDRNFCGNHSTVSSWLDGYNVALDHMGNRGVALGTDTNGLSPLIPPGSGGFVTYPFAVAQGFSPPSTVVSSMDRHRIGSRQFNFHLDGIATYGMLPDFLQALNNMSAPHNPQRALKVIYHSAEDTIQMWEKAETVAKTLTTSCTSGLKACSGICVDLNRDANNCGICGRQCQDGKTCQAGECKSPPAGSNCPSGTRWCANIEQCRTTCPITPITPTPRPE